MKGDKKRKRAGKQFTRGHEPYYRPKPLSEEDKTEARRSIRRASDRVYQHVMANTDNGLLLSRDAEGTVVSATQPFTEKDEPVDLTSLRPLKEAVSDAEACGGEDNSNTYIIVHREKCCMFWNKVFREHIAFAPQCTGDLVWHDQGCEKWGLGWKMAVKCTACPYKSKTEKLYEEAESDSRGRRAATINNGIQVGLSKQGMSNTGLREVIASANIIPPSTSGMQKAANRLGRKIVEANTKDIKAIREELKHLNEIVGKPKDCPLPAETDATYNNSIYSGIGKTPMQAGTQVTTLVAEGLTAEKKIISVRTYRKICSCRRKTAHREDCSANLRVDDSIGNEGRYLTDAIRDLNSDGITIGDLTLDGDSSARCAARDIVQPNNADIRPQYCTRHLTRSLEKHFKKASFSANMFPGRTKLQKDQAHNRFCHDLGDRVNAEFNAAHADLHADVPALKEKLAHICDAIVDCYRGSCVRCTEHSYVCSETHPWYRPYLDMNPVYKRRREFIKPTAQDIQKLRQSLAIRLSVEAVDKTINNTNQNKCEGSNRGIKKAVPNNLTFTYNYNARVNSAVHSINNGPGESMAKLCEEVGAPLAANSSVRAAIRKMDGRVKKDKHRKKSQHYKESRRRARQQRYQAYDMKKNQEAGYDKDADAREILEFYVPPRRVPGQLQDHDYSTRRMAVFRHTLD